METLSQTTALHTDRDRLDRSVWYSGYLLAFLATGEETGGKFSLVEEVGRRGHSAEPPTHIQTREEECFYVLEGKMTFYVGADVVPAPAGTFVQLPRGVPHRFTLDSEHVRVLNLCVPAGFEGFFRELSEPAPELALPPAPGGPPDTGKLIATAAKYGVRILPPE